MPIHPRGVISPLSEEEEKQAQPNAESEDLSLKLSVALGMVQMLMLGAQGTGAHYSIVTGGWPIPRSLREWGRSINSPPYPT